MDLYWWRNVRKFYTCKNCRLKFLNKEDVRRHQAESECPTGYTSSPWKRRKSNAKRTQRIRGDHDPG